MAAAVAIVSVSAGSVAIASPPAAKVAAPGTTRPEAVTAREASLKAMDTGQPVEIPSLTTETEKVVANPTGTFTLTKDVLPVRVRRDGRWLPVDSTLRRHPDGTLSPSATPSGLRFSGGGAAPLAVMTSTGTQVALSWPGSLPAPRLPATPPPMRRCCPAST